ncbi:MAG: hypothetical protein ABIR79_18150 [Candidatus Binatia bacterium]
MTIGQTRVSILAGVILSITLPAPSAHALLGPTQLKCVQAVAKGSLGIIKGKLKLLQKCENANLKDGSCSAPEAAAVTKLETKLAATIDKACTLNNFALSLAGYPGPCADANPGDGFTTSDLKDCIKTSHTAIIDSMIALEYDSSVTGPLVSADLKCQAEIGKQSAGLTLCVLKAVGKCRIDVLKEKLVGVPPDLCATNNPKTLAAIQKCEAKVTAGIAKKCTTPQIASLKVCTPDQPNAASAATCLTDTHTDLTDGPEIAAPADLIDYVFAARGGVCGDNIVNNLNEECDGTDDSGCPGLCGTPLTPDGFFACLCKDKPRLVVAEHSDADTDNGWLGLSVDGDVVEGGGYIVDLYDCDGGGLCNAGPSCSLPPHSPCGVPESAAVGTTSDSVCAGLGEGTCRKERTATGPHCYSDINKKCSLTNAAQNTATCNAPGDFCVTTPHGAPVAAAAGGVSVCNVSTFSEDVVGTLNLLGGTSSLKVRQRARTHLAIQGDKPCPVCGGFCGVSRDKCAVDADCGGEGPCITEAICSDGTRKDKACRRTPPFGGDIPFFGTTSSDCPPSTQIIAGLGGGLDINPNPRTTGSVTLLPTFPCTSIGASGNRCLGGSSEGRSCTTASECPGGTCNGQCFCSGQVQPNPCAAACVGGSSDSAGCSADTDCPGGFCHNFDCRVDPSDLDSNQEGICTAGPVDKFCSVTTYHTCSTAAQCTPPNCADCQLGETCDARARACFVNSGITRTGTPGTPDRETAAVYCVPANDSAINTSAGFPGPGALIQREYVQSVP